MVLRGQCITRAKGVRRVIPREVEQAEAALRELECRRPEHPELQQALLDAKEEAAKQTERLRSFDYMKYLERTHAERDKSGSLLAWLTNPVHRGPPLVEIEDEWGIRHYTQEKINEVFARYYTKLYRKTRAEDPTEVRGYLADLCLTNLSPEEAEEQGADITQREVWVAIKGMAQNKTPGTDGLPAKFYVLYTEELAPHLVTMYQEAENSESCPRVPGKPLFPYCPSAEAREGTARLHGLQTAIIKS